MLMLMLMFNVPPFALSLSLLLLQTPVRSARLLLFLQWQGLGHIVFHFTLKNSVEVSFPVNCNTVFLAHLDGH